MATHEQAYARIVSTAGTADQKDRFCRGELASEDVLAIARDSIFESFAALRVRRKLGASAIPHPRTPAGLWTCGVEPPVRWATLPHPELTDREGITWRMVLAACALAARHPLLQGEPAPTAEPRIHVGRCTRCEQRAGEASALVSVSVGGVPLSREYLL